MVIKLKLDPASIQRAINQVEGYKKTLEETQKEIVQQLTEDGLAKAQELIPVDTGEARASLTSSYDEAANKGTITANGEYCKFIEFGTGVVGKASPHPSEEMQAAMDWAYGVGKYIFTTKDGRTGWYYPVGDGTYRFTQGMPSRPFMYETSQYLKQRYEEILKEKLNGKG